MHPGEGTRRHGSQRADDVTAVERVEDRNAVGAAHYGLTVEREGLGAQQRRGNGDRRVAAAPVVAAPGEKTNLVADAAHLQSQSGPAGGFTAREGMQGGMYPSERNGMCQNIGLPCRSATGQITSGWGSVSGTHRPPNIGLPGDAVNSAMLRLIERRLAVGKQPQDCRGGATSELGSMHQGVERRRNARNRIATEAMIWRGRYSVVPCVVRDLSPAGAGLVLSDRIRSLPPEFDLTVDHVTHRCIAVWRQRNRMGLKFKSIFDSRRDRALWIALALCGGQ